MVVAVTVLILTVVLIAKADAEYCKAERKKAKADAGQSIAKALASLGVAAGTLSQVQLEQVAPLIKSAASVEEVENLVQQAERPVLSRS